MGAGQPAQSVRPQQEVAPACPRPFPRTMPGIARQATGTDNRTMSNRSVPSEWQRRIARAEELGAQYSLASEILRFYVAIARFQENFYGELASLPERSNAGAGEVAAGSQPFARQLPPELTGRFGTLLSLVEQHGPDPLREAARELRDGGEDSHFQLLAVFWKCSGTRALRPSFDDFFSRAFLQPYAAGIRSRSRMHWGGPTPHLRPVF